MNLFDLFAKLSLDTSEYESGVKNASQDGQGLKKSMTDVQKQSETLGNKIKVLSAQYESSAKDVEDLTQQFNDSVQKTGAASRESQELADKLADAEKKANGLKGEIDGLNTELSGLSGGAKKAASSFSDDLNKAADIGAQGLKIMAGVVVATGGSLVALTESTREYRTEMGKLNTAFETNGFTAETAYETYADLQAVLGDTGQTVEAVNNLSALADSEEDLNDWTTILTGAYAKFGASLPVEGLAETANETSRTGILTGQLTDAINWAAEAGETFGVTLKENIEFTEASKEELAKMTEAQVAEYEARKAQYEEIEAYNQMVSEATSAEEFFQIALDNCTTSQERQKLITETLSDLYTEAGEAYLDANEDLINANKSQERLNKAMADLGESVEPAISEFKDLGASILEDLNEPVKDATTWIRQSLIPGLRDFVSFVKGNWPAVSTVLVTTTTVLGGLTIAIKGAAAAQAAYNAVMALSPTGAAIIALGAITTGLLAFAAATEKTFKPIQTLTDEELALIEATDAAAEAFQRQQESTEQTMSGIDAQMGYITKLSDELQGLASASGEVEEKDRARAEFILGQLNEALGTEYKMVDGVIQKYDDLTESIEEVIIKKTANALLEAGNADYVTALQNEEQAYDAVLLAQKNLQAQTEHFNKRKTELAEEYADYAAQLEVEYRENVREEIQNSMQDIEDELTFEENALAEKQAIYNNAADDYKAYRDTIIGYEDASVAVLEGNYEKAKDILLGKQKDYQDWAGIVDLETARVLDKLYEEAVQAGIEAEKFNKNWNNGTEGMFQPIALGAEDAYGEAMSKFVNAYADAMGVGSDLGEGLSDGLDSQRQTFLQKAASMITSAISAMRQAADSHSPSRKTEALSEDMGDGSVIGIEKSTPKVVAAAKKQTDAVIEAYSGEAAFSVATPSAPQLSTLVSGAGSHSRGLSGGNVEALLTQILHKLDLGVYLDGKTLVGKLAGQMDTELGLIQAGKMRGVRV